MYLFYHYKFHGKVKDKEHLKLRCLVQVGPGCSCNPCSSQHKSRASDLGLIPQRSLCMIQHYVHFYTLCYACFNGEPAVLIHHGIVRRWRCGSLVTQRPLTLLLSMAYQLLLSMTYHFQSRLGKTDCTDIWVIKLKNQVSPSIGFRVPHSLYQHRCDCDINIVLCCYTVLYGMATWTYLVCLGGIRLNMDC